MDFGAFMFHTDYSMPIIDLAQACEARGFESLWAPEHSHIPLTRKSPFPGGGEVPKMYYDAMDPFVILTAAAAGSRVVALHLAALIPQHGQKRLGAAPPIRQCG